MSVSVPRAEEASVSAKVVALQESVAKKGRELDAATSSHAREAHALRSLLARYLLRVHVRSHKQKRILMNLHLGCMDMQESLQREEQRKASGDTAPVVYDEKKMPSKNTLRKLGTQQNIAHTHTHIHRRAHMECIPPTPLSSRGRR